MGTETEGFAEALRGLKERSGLSYGALAKRAHLSTSTLHRYCNGDAVPTEFAPVDRLARLCGASRDEMVALHRRWIVADDARRRGRATAPEAAGRHPDGPRPVDRPDEADAVPAEPAEPAAAGRGAVADEPAAGRETAAAGSAARHDGSAAGRDEEEPSSGPAGRDPGAGPVAVLGPAPPRATGGDRSRRRVRLAAVVAAAAVVTASTALAVTMDAGAPRGTGAGTANSADRVPATGPAAPSGTPRPSTSTSSAPPLSAPAGASVPAAGVTASAAAPAGTVPPGAAGPGRRQGGPPLAVDVRPYVWRDPCSQVYVVDRPPAQVPPPPSEQDARGWVTALGGAPGGDMLMELVVQGTGSETVVLHALHVRVVEKDAPLPWNAYTMGVGCGGDMTPQSLDVNLDVARPHTVPVAGRQGDREIPAGDFPYKVSAGDPQMLRVTAHTVGHAVRWYLELEWSSGDRRGTLRVDDHGRPFATSAVTGRPAYGYPLGGGGWIPQETGED
ncbi:helix-turn-helix domain-containing protein [Streptomyces sp. HMX112]|uniref:transcriptional regulator n=1 Tax=Streptomyces sp. HMX112 TaxID=3390850 RepID=UPI003A8118D8